jgi:CRISPR-associated endonuclease/helicase Cas3
MTSLLAKSRTHGELSLEQHLLDTERAALALFAPEKRLGQRWPAFFKVNEQDWPKLLLELRIAALLNEAASRQM